jgi:hypothetical protein
VSQSRPHCFTSERTALGCFQHDVAYRRWIDGILDAPPRQEVAERAIRERYLNSDDIVHAASFAEDLAGVLLGFPDRGRAAPDRM